MEPRPSQKKRKASPPREHPAGGPPDITIAELYARAKKHPGKCAVCGRKMPKPRFGGRPSIVCGERLRKGCRRAYQAAYRATNAPTLMREISFDIKHPTLPGRRLVTLSCGHRKTLRTGDVNSGRRTSKCLACGSGAAIEDDATTASGQRVLFPKLSSVPTSKS